MGCLEFILKAVYSTGASLDAKVGATRTICVLQIGKREKVALVF